METWRKPCTKQRRAVQWSHRQPVSEAGSGELDCCWRWFFLIPRVICYRSFQMLNILYILWRFMRWLVIGSIAGFSTLLTRSLSKGDKSDNMLYNDHKVLPFFQRTHKATFHHSLELHMKLGFGVVIAAILLLTVIWLVIWVCFSKRQVEKWEDSCRFAIMIPFTRWNQW
jgi:hypothetical protein